MFEHWLFVIASISPTVASLLFFRIVLSVLRGVAKKGVGHGWGWPSVGFGRSERPIVGKTDENILFLGGQISFAFDGNFKAGQWAVGFGAGIFETLLGKPEVCFSLMKTNKNEEYIPECSLGGSQVPIRSRSVVFISKVE